MSRLKFLEQKTVLLDGAMGTELIASGLKRGDCPDQWNISHPDIVSSIHAAYAAAGADIITTNTFGASRPRLGKYGLGDQTGKINRMAVQLARNCIPKSIRIAGDIGPTGLMFAPMGQATAEEISDIAAEQAEYLSEAGADLILVETQYDLREAKAMLTGIRKNLDLPVAVTMTFNQTRRGYFTMVGDTPENCVSTLEDLGASITGANCTLTPHSILGLSEILLKTARNPVLIQPNAGQPDLTGETPFYHLDPQVFGSEMYRLVEAGIRLVGGCCGTSPEHIRALRGLIPRL